MTPFDENGVFLAAVHDSGLRRAAVRGAGVTIFAQGLSLLVQIAATVILARILLPSDFGLVAMVLFFCLLVGNFGLNGFTEVVIQRETMSRELAANLFWINCAAGLLIAACFAALGPLMARFYHNRLVSPVAAGMAVSMAIASLSVVHLALLKRAMRFTAVSIISVAARSTMVLVSLAFALAGWGYWALVMGYISQQLVSLISAVSICRWRPRLPRRVSGTAASVRFALNVYSRFIFSYFSSNSDNVLVGWRFNAQALGFYKKAYDLFALPTAQLVAPITAVIVTTLSRFHRDEARYRRYFLSGMSVLAFVGMAIGADFTLIGKDLIRLLLGRGWGEAGKIFAFFGPGVGLMLLYNTHGWIHLSIGRPDRWFRWSVVEFLVTFSLFLAGLHFGPSGVALAWTVSFFILLIPAFWYAGRPIGFGVRPILAVVWKFFLAAASSGLAAFFLLRRLALFVGVRGAFGAFERTLSASLIFFGIYAAAVIILHRGFAPFIQSGLLLRELLPQKRVDLNEVSLVVSS